MMLSIYRILASKRPLGPAALLVKESRSEKLFHIFIEKRPSHLMSHFKCDQIRVIRKIRGPQTENGVAILR